MNRRWPAVWGALLLLLAARGAGADDWPQWRGPTRDGVWREQRVLERLPEGQLPLLWRAKISSGYSGPTVADGRVYVTDRVSDPKQTERVLCFSAATGKPLWKLEYDAVYHGVGYEAGPRASVSLDEGRAFALGTMGHLHALDAATGELVWKRDLNADYKIEMPIWGIAASPLVHGDLLILQIGGDEGACVVALDKRSGAEVWRALDDRASYAAPILIDQADRKVLVVWTGDHVVGLNPASGKVEWQHPFTPTRMVIGITTPITDGRRLFVSSFYDGSLMLLLHPRDLGVDPEWRRLGPDEQHTDSLHAIISTPCLKGDYVYGVDSYGELRCLDAHTGDRIWSSSDAVKKNRWATIHMVQNGDRTWMFNEQGELIICQLSPQGYQELSRAKLIAPTRVQLDRRDGVCWAHPAFANRHVFARNDEELVAASLAAE